MPAPARTPEKHDADLHARMTRVRAHRRPMSPSEGARMARRANLKRALERLRPIRWPQNPLSATEAAFVLNVTPAAISAAIAEGRLQATREGRACQVSRADVQASLASQVREAEALGLAVPDAARHVAGAETRSQDLA
jgi:excisionase family DNA binding protein